MLKQIWGKLSADYVFWIPLLIVQVIGLNHTVAAQAAYDLHQSERSDAVTVLHLYPDVYQRGLNTPARLLAELEAEGVDLTRFGARMARQMFSKVSSRSMFVVEITSIENGCALQDGRVMRLIPRIRRAGRS